jgi:hypothetical protein
MKKKIHRLQARVAVDTKRRKEDPPTRTKARTRSKRRNNVGFNFKGGGAAKVHQYKENSIFLTAWVVRLARNIPVPNLRPRGKTQGVALKF